MSVVGVIEKYEEPLSEDKKEDSESRRLWREPNSVSWARGRPGWGSGAEWYRRIELRFPSVEELFRPVRAERAYTMVLALQTYLPGDLIQLIVRLALWRKAS